VTVTTDKVVAVSEPEGRGAAWTEERGTSDEGRRRQEAPRRRAEDTAEGDAASGQALSYEQARDKLAAVVKRLEAGGLTLEQSLELWERGERLAAVCEEWLDGARARLAAAMAKRDDAAAEDEDPQAPF
jgi:exodeoxyribonuclease VII small subunit